MARTGLKGRIDYAIALFIVAALIVPIAASAAAGGSSAAASAAASTATSTARSTAASTAASNATSATASTTASAATATPSAPETAARQPAAYAERAGTVSLTLSAIFARIPQDSDEYKVSAKRVEIAKRRLSVAMHDKFTADNSPAPIESASAKRVAYEKQRHIDWKNAEMEVEGRENDLKSKLDSIKSALQKQYTDLLNLKRGLATYEDEITKLDTDISQLEAQIKVGVAKASDMDTYSAQKTKLLADVAAKKRDIALAERNLKTDLKIDQSKAIELAPFGREFARYDDKRINQDIASAVASCYAVASGQKKLDLLKEERAIMVQWDREGAMTTDLQNNEISVREAEYSLFDARKKQETSLWSSYYSLLNQEAQVEIDRLSVQLAESEHRLEETRLGLGLAKGIDEQNARIALEDAKATLQTTIDDYMRMADDFRDSLK